MLSFPGRYLGVFSLLSLVVLSLFVGSSTVEARPYLPDFAGLVKKLKPVVVNISVTPKSRKRRFGPGDMPKSFEGSPFEDFFHRFFDQIPRPGERRNRSMGSGVIFDADGLIVTNHHVVENAGKIKVRLWDERELQAKVVGVDEKTDLALIRVHAGKALPAATFGDSDKVEVGSWAIAIGNPFGFSATVTAGIISA
ncbi:trypsin-like peptidase domain-containing protein, partial [Magnetococcales bacterium HHB-1]